MLCDYPEHLRQHLEASASAEIAQDAGTDSSDACPGTQFCLCFCGDKDWTTLEAVTVHMTVYGYRFRESPNMNGHLYLKHQQMHRTVLEYLTESFGLC